MEYIILRKGLYYSRKEYAMLRLFTSIEDAEKHMRSNLSSNSIVRDGWEVVAYDDVDVYMAEQKLREST